MNIHIPFILSHESALEFWRTAFRQGAMVEPCMQEDAMLLLEQSRGAVHTKSLQDFIAASRQMQPGLPLNLLTSSRNDRRSTKLATFRCMQGTFPDGALMRVTVPKLEDSDIGLYVSSPEFTFVQMANAMDIWEHIELGFELCGNYSVTPENKGCVPYPAVSTPDKLSSFAVAAQGITGAKQARIAARHVTGGSRSPKETRMCMLACLPRSLGGMGAKPALLNQSILLPDAAARILGTRTCTPDLYWPNARIAVEFDNRPSEDRALRAEHDKRKANAYRMLGIDVVSITRGDLANADYIRGRFAHINKKCSKRLIVPNEKQKKRQGELLAWLQNK